jgi:hypothetical protein
MKAYKVLYKDGKDEIRLYHPIKRTIASKCAGIYSIPLPYILCCNLKDFFQVFMVADEITLDDLKAELFLFPLRTPCNNYRSNNLSLSVLVDRFWNNRFFISTTSDTLQYLGGTFNNWRRMPIKHVQKCLKARTGARTLRQLLKGASYVQNKSSVHI